MTFDKFQAHNRERCETKFHNKTDWWPIELWCLAIAGEAGEACNIAKKVVRGDFTLEVAREALLKELADILTYVDLAITTLGARTEDVLIQKFNEVSRRVGGKEISG